MAHTTALLLFFRPPLLSRLLCSTSLTPVLLSPCSPKPQLYVSYRAFFLKDKRLYVNIASNFLFASAFVASYFSSFSHQISPCLHYHHLIGRHGGPAVSNTCVKTVRLQWRTVFISLSSNRYWEILILEYSEASGASAFEFTSTLTV